MGVNTNGIGNDRYSTILRELNRLKRLVANGEAGPGGSVEWGGIGGFLPDQSDLQLALDAKAPINNPVFTGTPTLPGFTLSGTITPSANASYNLGSDSFRFESIFSNTNVYTASVRGYGSLIFGNSSGTEFGRFSVTNGNLLINTTVDSGEKLQVNGTSKFTGNATINGSLTVINGTSSSLSNSTLNMYSGNYVHTVNGAGASTFMSYNGQPFTWSAAKYVFNSNYNGASLSAASGTESAFLIAPTVAQSSSAGYSAFKIGVYESTVGSGVKLLIDAGTNTLVNGGGTYTSRFSIDNNGNTIASGNTSTGGGTGFNSYTIAGGTGLIQIGRNGNQDMYIYQKAAYNDRLYGRMVFGVGPAVATNDPAARIPMIIYSNGDIRANGTDALFNGNTILGASGTPVDTGEKLQVNGTSKFTNNINLTGGRLLTNGVDLLLPTGGGTYIFGTNIAFGNSQAGALYYANITSSGVTIGKGLTAIDASSILDIASTTKGVLLPRLTTAQKTAIATPATGLLVYDTDALNFSHYNGTTWRLGVTSDAAGSVMLGNTTASNTSTPVTLSLGGTYSNAAASNLKLLLRDTPGDIYGIGTSSMSQMEFAVPNSGSYNWYVGGSSRMSLSSTGTLTSLGIIPSGSRNLGSAGSAWNILYTSFILNPTGVDLSLGTGEVARGINFRMGGAATDYVARFMPTTSNFIIQTGGTYVDTGEKFQLTGTSRFTGNVTIVGDLYPETNNTRTIGTGVLNYSTVNSRVFRSDNALTLSATAGDLIFSMYSGTAMRTTGLGRRWQIQDAGTYTDIPSARFAVNSTTEGALLPRMTTAQFAAIASKAQGLEAYSTDDAAKLWWDGTRTVGFRYNGTKFQGYDGTTWIDLN